MIIYTIWIPSDTIMKFDAGIERDWEHRVAENGTKQVQAMSMNSLLDSVGIVECDLLKSISKAPRSRYSRR